MSPKVYGFLSHPPQKQSALISGPLPAVPFRARSHTFTARISSWAAHVTPGTPAPISPAHQGSVILTRNRSGSHSFLTILDTPCTPSANKQFNTDLTSLGYTSVFELSLPLTPTNEDIKAIPIPPIPSTLPSRTLTRIRSLSALRTRSKPATVETPTMITPSSPLPQTKKAKYTSGIFSTKKSSTVRNKVHHPPPLSNDLLLMQFADGGSLESHVKRVMEKRAKEARGSRAKSSAIGYNASAAGVGSVHRDEKGGVWYDPEEEMEYAHLIEKTSGGPNDAFAGWVAFRGAKDDQGKENADIRRGSAASTVISSSSSSSGDDVNVTLGLAAVQPQDDNALAAFGVVQPLFSSVPLAPFTSEPATIRRGSQGDITNLCDKARPRGKDRRRPTPLKLTSSSRAVSKFLPPASAPAHVSMYRLDTVRKEFLDASFVPAAADESKARAPTYTVIPSDGNELMRVPTSETRQSTKTVGTFAAGLKKVVKKKKSAMGMRGLWKGLRD